MGERTMRLVLAWGLLAALAGCGKAGAPDAAGSAVVGAAGGTVTEPGGASVVVSAGAFEAETTLRIAKDSTGAPALPAGLTAAGDTYVITPHGGSFAQAVEVRIPAPAVSLQPNEEFKLAKAQPGGDWVILGDSALAGGVLSAQVSSFSYFLPVVVSFPLPVFQLPSFSVVTSIHCIGQPCSDVVGTADGAFTVTTNSGQFPVGCAEPHLLIVDRRYRDGLLDRTGTQTGSFSGGDVALGYYPGFPGVRQEVYMSVELMCLPGGQRTRLGSEQAIKWRQQLAYPGLAVAGSAAVIDVVEELSAEVRAVLIGGAALHDAPDGTRVVPTPANRAVIDWERSDDGGASWRAIARSYQDEANPNADPSQPTPWAIWSVSHRFIASSSDQGALIRVHACYTPPDVPALPCVTGPATRLNVLQQSALPSFTSAPRSVLVTAGQPATFTATAGGAPAPALQWQTRAANDAGAWSDATSGTGATTGSYTTAALSLADNGRQYRVVATNAAGSVESPAVSASVSDADVAPTITTQPAALSVTTGSDAAFAVVARGTEVLAYQWRKDGTPISGATGPVLRLSAVGAGSAGAYSVLVTNVAGSLASDAAVLTVSPGTPALTPPTIVTQPRSIAVGEGSDATFAVGVSGSGPLAFQWYREDAAIAGATAAVLSLAGVTPGDQGNYGVVVTNAAGSAASSRASLEVSPGPTPPDVTPPTITTQPSTLVVLPGGAATLAVAVTGAGPLSYQWSRDGIWVDGGTGPVLTLPSVGPGDAGTYTVVITSIFGTAVSTPAQLILVGAPLITTQPADVSVVEGGSATFSVAAFGSGLGYQWTRNGIAIPGAIGATYTTPALGLAGGGALYAVLVYNGAGLVQSQPAALTITPAPAVAAPPSAGKLAAGPNHTCAVKADGTVACWGRNSRREVTPANGFDQDLPVIVPGVSGAVQVAAGFQRSCAIDGAGGLSCWGGGALAVEPLRDAGGLAITGVRGVALGTAHGCFIDAGGSVMCWGDNSVGQLGQGTTSAFVAVPVAVSRSGGAVLTSAVSLSAGAFHTCALTSAGEVVCWGRGAIGDGSPAQPTGDQLALLAGAPAVTGASAMASGESHACAALSAGGVKCWGANGSAQLGTRNTTAQLSPVSVIDLPGLLVGVTTIAARADTTCVIPASGEVACWGAVAPASLSGNLTYGPVVTSSLSMSVTGLASGVGHSCALLSDGSLECWGANPYGQLGVGGTIGLLIGGPSPPGTSVAGGATFWRP